MAEKIDPLSEIDGSVEAKLHSMGKATAPQLAIALGLERGAVMAALMRLKGKGAVSVSQDDAQPVWKPRRPADSDAS